MQKLILPINKMFVTASYKTEAYAQRFSLTHYGFDAISSVGNATIYASGTGKVLLSGSDSIVGNLVIVRYPDVLNHKTGRSADVIMRYFHLRESSVKAGDTLTKDSKIGYYGNTGKYSTGAHLHFEFDSEVSLPARTATLTGNSSLLQGIRKNKTEQGGKMISVAEVDSSIDPTELLFVKSSAPDCQSVSADTSSYCKNRYALPESARLPDWED